MASRPHKGPGHVPQCDPRGISSRVFTQETAVAKYKKDSDTDANSKKKTEGKKSRCQVQTGALGCGGQGEWEYHAIRRPSVQVGRHGSIISPNNGITVPRGAERIIKGKLFF